MTEGRELQMLRDLTHAVQPLPEEDWQSFSAIWKPFSAKRKEILTVAGEQEKYLYFVCSGVQRIFYEDEQGHEATVVFTYGPSFGGVLDALMLNKTSSYFYETLTASSFLRCPAAELHSLAEQKPSIERMLRKGITLALSGLLERLVELQSFTAEEKFSSLLKRSPHILQLVPHKYLANYIGIDPANFSKFINRIRI